MTVEEFFVWQQLVDGHHELVDGFIVPHPDYWSPSGFTSPDNEHALVLATVIRLLGARLRPPCHVYAGTGAIVDENAANVPDLAVSCKDARNEKALREPRFVFEISSPKTARVDTGRKVTDYLAIASLEAYVFIDRKKRSLTVYRPGVGPQTFGEGSVPIADDVVLPIDDVFA